MIHLIFDDKTHILSLCVGFYLFNLYLLYTWEPVRSLHLNFH